MKRVRISRRTLLKGVGGITIGLPWLEEMLSGTVVAGSAEAVPMRAFNVFFGLGIPAPLQAEGFEGVLEPLKPLADKLLILQGVDHVRCDQPGINAHYDGASAAFTAEPPNGDARAGGASIDQAIRAAHYPNGLPPGVLPSLVAGTFFRRIDRMVRYVHSFNPDGTAAATIQEQPKELFERVFGTAEEIEAGDPRNQRLRRSVLDSVVEQADFLTGQRSPLGANSRRRIGEHLERVREYEQRAFNHRPVVREAQQMPSIPELSTLPHGGQADPGGEGIDITLEELTAEWQLMADLYALAIQCDRARFGAITFLAAGERIRLTGDYRYQGRQVFEFNDAKQRKSSGANACSHEWWHAFREDRDNEQLRAHVHLKLAQVAYFLQQLDTPDCLESNGRSILDNSLFTISTESGDGRHNDPKRELSGIFHAVTSAGGRFRTGQILPVQAEGLDLYNTLLDAVGVGSRLGPRQRPAAPVDAIRT